MARKVYKFDDYKKESRAEPFPLDTGNGEIEIKPPDGETSLQIGETNSPRQMLKLLCGEHYRTVHELIAEQPREVMDALVTDMLEHFGVAVSPPADGQR